MFLTKIKLFFVLLLAIAVTSCSSHLSENYSDSNSKTNTTPPPPTPVIASPGTAKDLVSIGKEIFTGSGSCSGCHGVDGVPDVKLPHIPNFTDSAWHKKETDQDLTTVIKNGKNVMPKYNGSENDIPALIAYIRSLNKTSTNSSTSPTK